MTLPPSPLFDARLRVLPVLVSCALLLCAAGAGNIVAGYRCSSVTRFGSGLYFVDFTALATDITSRPFLASCTSQAATATCVDVRGSYSSDDLSRIVVTADTADDGAFTLVIF